MTSRGAGSKQRYNEREREKDGAREEEKVWKRGGKESAGKVAG